ncbi:MAG TPA: DUF6794 domain-containing protein [Phycisphaerae bacterium]|nr:DUF6794 domain-containing protein [Phycisphaerae bacterium]
MGSLRRMRVSVDFKGERLESAFDLIQEKSEYPLHINWEALEAASIEPDQPVTLKLEDVDLATLLEELLVAAGAENETVLGYEVVSQILVSTTETLPDRPDGIWTTPHNDERVREGLIYKVSLRHDPTSPTGLYVPADLEECFTELKRMLTPELVAEMKADPDEKLIVHHFGLGLWIRNNWGLWGNSRLAKYFESHGVHHPDDMSGIILTSFWRRLNNQPLRFEEQIEFYQTYWKKQREIAATQKDDQAEGEEEGDERIEDDGEAEDDE